jgi:hypothetical protein
MKFFAVNRLALRAFSVAGLLLLLLGCAEVEEKPEAPKPAPVEDPLLLTDIDALLAFGADMTGKTAPERAQICRNLLDRQKQTPVNGIQLRLVTGRLLSDNCGEIPKILESADAITPETLPDERVRNWFAVQKEALRRVFVLAKRPIVMAERKKKALSAASLKGSKHGGKVRPEEGDNARLLRDKLEAIRAMEKKLDETSGGD